MTGDFGDEPWPPMISRNPQCRQGVADDCRPGIGGWVHVRQESPASAGVDLVEAEARDQVTVRRRAADDLTHWANRFAGEPFQCLAP